MPASTPRIDNLLARSLDELSPSDIADLFMEAFKPHVDDDLIAVAVSACLQGRDAAWAEDVLESRIADRARAVDLKSRMVLQGIRLLQNGVDADVMRARLMAYA